MGGGTLRDRLHREKQLTFLDAIRIAQAVADALTHAHEQGLVHRDVKPENILFSGSDVYLSDFGIARALEHATGETTTSTGVVRGTPAYMSPEQASGQPECDGRSDIYALGCVLYEMVAGMTPFVGPTPQSVMAQRVSFDPPPLGKYRSRTPASLDGVISKAMSRLPADRYQTAREFSEALARVVTDLENPRYRTMRAERDGYRRRALAIGGLGLLAAVGITMYALRPAPVDPRVIPEGDPRRIAVLYLETLTPDQVPAHVADGITEDLIDRLAGARALHVISPGGVRPYYGGTASFDSIARALKVGTIVHGSVARSGNTLRVNARLIDAGTGRQLDSRSLVEQWTELFTLQDELAEQVQFWLRQRLGDEIAIRSQRAATRSFAAWEAAQLASAETRRAVEAGTTRGDTTAALLFLRADSHYVRAAQLDPRWILPVVKRGTLALLALSIQSPVPPRASDSLAYRAMTRRDRRILWTKRALDLANEALAMQADEATGLVLRGQARLALATFGGPGRGAELGGAEADLRAALATRPDFAAAWAALAELLLQRGAFADASDAARRGYEADAFFELRRVVDVAFTSSLFAEQFDDAWRWCQLGLARYAGDPRFTECEIRWLGSSGRSRADAERAWHAVEEVERRDTLGLLRATWGFRRLMVAAVLVRSGLPDSARAILREVTEKQPDVAKRPSEAAICYVLALLGDKDAAIARLTELTKSGPSPGAAPVALLPWFKPLRGDPRFAALARPGPP
jgi:serine/threonine-protein kinase